MSCSAVSDKGMFSLTKGLVPSWCIEGARFRSSPSACTQEASGSWTSGTQSFPSWTMPAASSISTSCDELFPCRRRSPENVAGQLPALIGKRLEFGSGRKAVKLGRTPSPLKRVLGRSANVSGGIHSGRLGLSGPWFAAAAVAAGPVSAANVGKRSSACADDPNIVMREF